MGQGVSKRQSYTPGETKDAGLPSGPVEVNGEVKTGTNGQVELLSNKEVRGDGVANTSSASVTPSTSSASPTSPTDKKKKKTPRFVFNFKRTGSGKRSRKAKNEANGVRPVSYPAPTSGQHKDSTRPQSLFLEDIAIPEDEDGKIETVSLSSNDDHREKKKESHRKTSSTSKPSSPKAKPDKDKKKGDSQKKKNSKKKEKEAKAKADKVKKEENKEVVRRAAEEDKKIEEKNRVVEESMNAAVAKMEELSPPQVAMPEAKLAGAGGKVTLEVNTDAKVVAEEKEAIAKEANTEATSESPATKVESPEVEIPKVVFLEAEPPEAETITTPSEDDHETEDVPALGGKVEEVIEVRVAAVANSPISLSHEDAADQPAEVKETEGHHGEMSAQQEAVVSELILVKETLIDVVPAENEDRSEGEKDDLGAGAEETAADPQGHLSIGLSAPTGEMQQKISQDEDKEETTAITVESIHVSLSADEERITTKTGESSEVCDADVMSAIKKGAADEEDALGEKPDQEVDTSPKPVQSELVGAEAEETMERKMEVAVESAPVEDVAKQVTGSEITLEAAKHDLNKEVDAAAAQLPASDLAAHAAAAAVVAAVPRHVDTSAAAKPETQDFPPPLSPTQMKAIQKERKLAKKREEKEKARKDKEEKKRVKEERKREAKERKQQDREQKERKLREARDKLKVTANMTVEVPQQTDGKTEVKADSNTDGQPVGYVKVVAEEAVAASRSTTTKAAPSAPAAQQPSTPTAPVDLNVGLHAADKFDFEPSTSKDGSATEPQGPGHKDAENKDGSDGGALGSSVKDIISSIELSVVSSSESPAEPADGTQPPAVPNSPYPDEDEEPSESSEASSPVSTLSPFSSAPQSPAGVDISPKTPISPETGESARSGMLRKIELGPRLRTAILRKSSSGAESEEKRVSLTLPRHVQVSDLTPPPRKQGPRRPLQQAWSPLGAYNSRGRQRPVSQPLEDASSKPSSCQDKEPQPVTEEVMAVASAVSVEAAPPPTECQAVSPNENKAEEEATATDPPEADPGCEENKEFSVIADLVTPGSRVSIHADPESPTVVSVASIVLGAGEKAGEVMTDTFPSAEPPHHLPEANGTRSHDDDVTVDEVHALTTDEVQHQPSEAALQKMAEDLVTQVQQAAQEEAAATVQAVSEDSGDVSVTCDVSDSDAKGGVEEEDCVTEIHSSVHCSAELRQEATDSCVVSSSDDCCVSDSAVLTHSAAALIVDDVHGSSVGKDTMESLLNHSRDDGVSVSDCTQSQNECCQQPARVTEELSHSDLHTTESQVSEVMSDHGTRAKDLSPEDKLDDQEEDKEDLSTSTLSSEIEAALDEDTAQLQRLNKNYDISVVLTDTAADHEATPHKDVQLEHEDAAQTPSTSTTPTEGNTRDSDKDGVEGTPSSPELSPEVSLSSSAERDGSTHDALDTAVNGQVACSTQAAHNGTARDEVQSTHQEPEQEEEQKPVNGEEKTEGEVVTMTTSCNGSHVRLADSNETIDAYLKLQGGVVVGEGKKLADALEANNNESGGPSDGPAVHSDDTSNVTINITDTSECSKENVG